MTGRGWRWAVGYLLEPDAEATGHLRVFAPSRPNLDAMLTALSEIFAVERDRDHIVLQVGATVVGVIARSRLEPSMHDALLDARGPGSGSGATLPGPSIHYSVLRYRCRRCGLEARVLFVEEGGSPGCPEGHGPMRRVR